MSPRAAVCADRIGEVLDTESSVAQAVAPIAPESRAGVLEFDRLTFCYPGAVAPVLRDVTLELEPGAVVARVGAAEGPPLALARAEVEGLRQSLEAAVGMPARVRIEPRRDPFDAYA